MGQWKFSHQFALHFSFFLPFWLCQSAIAMPIRMGFMLSSLSSLLAALLCYGWVGVGGSLLHSAVIPLLPLPENIELFLRCPSLLLPPSLFILFSLYSLILCISDPWSEKAMKSEKAMLQT